MIPSIISLKIQSGKRFRLRLWLPVFILWPLAVLLFILMVPLLLIADFIVRICGIKLHLFSMVSALLALFASLCGTIVRVNSPRNNAIVYVKIY